MRKRLVGLLALALSTPLYATDAPLRISAVDVKGNKSVSREAILSQVHAQVGAPVDGQELRRDVAAIQDMGDFSTVTVTTTDGPGGIRVTFQVLENPIVDRIDIQGNHEASTQKLMALMETQPGHPLNTRVLMGDLNVINRYYDNELGYLVEPTHVRNVDLDGHGVLHVDLVEALAVKKVEVHGSSVFPPALLTSRLHLHEGALFNQNEVRDDANRLAQVYEGADYVLDTIRPQFDKATGVLSYQVVEATVDAVRVEGNTRTQEAFIVRTMQTKPGTVMRRKVVAQDASRLKALGLFESVRLEPEPTEKAGHVVLVARVKEAKTGNASVSAGYGGSNGTTPAGLTGTLNVVEKNLGGQGQAVSAQWQRGSTLNALSASYFDPHIGNGQDSLNVSVLDQQASSLQQNVSSVATNSEIALYDEKIGGGTVTVGHTVSDSVRTYTSATIEDVEITRGATSQFAPVGLGSGQVHGLGWGAVVDTRDDLGDPHQGTFSNLSVFGAGGPLQGDFNYSKVQGEWRRYVPIKSNTLVFRLWGGTLAGAAPSTDFFYVGGTNSLRGYNDNALFGSAFLVASSEYRFPLSKHLKELTGAVFVEAGNATQNRASLFNNMLTDEGIGLRFNAQSMGLGVIRLDYAVGQQGGRTSIGIGQSF